MKSRGHVVGADSQACAYLYGQQQATYAMGVINAGTAPSKLWLDVETANTWRSRRNQDMNEAVLDGMVNALPRGEVGVYSTHYRWNKIVGGLDTYSQGVLLPLDEWIPTGQSSASSSDCANRTLYPTFTNGTLDFIQYTSGYDYDLACA